MNKAWTASVLSVKMVYLFCIGAMGLVSISHAEMPDMSGHHMAMETEKSPHSACDMCAEVVENWSQDMVEQKQIADLVTNFSANFLALIVDTEGSFLAEAKYQFPPPEISVSLTDPIYTKTIVLRI